MIRKMALSMLDQSAATDGQVPVWDAASGLWVPRAQTGGSGGGGTPAAVREFRPGKIAGRYYTSPISDQTVANLQIALGLINLSPFYFDVATSIDRVALEVTNLIAGSSVELALYANASGVPSDLLHSWGTISGATVGAKEITVASVIPAGWTWMAARSVNGTPGVMALVPAGYQASVLSGWLTTAVGGSTMGWNAAATAGAALPTSLAGATLTPGQARARVLVRAA